jgi:hypothetical protein
MFKKRKTCIFFFLLIMIHIHPVGLGGQGLCERFAESQVDSEGRLPSHSWLVFVMDFNILMCNPCLDSFLKFYHEVSRCPKKGGVWGVMILDEIGKDSEEMKLLFRIAEKKVKGFAKANNIRCPILIDSSAVFRDIAGGGTAIILFDQRRNCVRKYSFPLQPGQKSEILEAIVY